MAYNTQNILTDLGTKPIPQYYNPTTDAYEALEGAGGASRVLLWDATGSTPLLTQTNAGYVQANDGAIATLGNTADTAVVDPTLSASEVALLKGLMKQLQGGGTGAAPVSLTGSNVINIQATNGGSVFSSSGSDAQSDNASLITLAKPQLYNGTSWDRVRNNTQGTLFASAARTATVSSPTQTNYNARGVQVIVNVTAVSGTGGLIVSIRGIDPISGSYYRLNVDPATITATGLYVYELYPGSTTAMSGALPNVTQRSSGVLPRTWYGSVFANDSSSYTYSVSYSLIN